jgi:hypothetical protein
MPVPNRTLGNAQIHRLCTCRERNSTILINRKVWFGSRYIAFFVTGISFFKIYGAANVMFAGIKFKDIDVIPHEALI